MLSVLQTRNHQVADLAFTPVTDLSEADRAQRAVTCRHQLAASQRPGDSRFWLLRLRVEFIHPEQGPRSLYLGHCEMVGEFELHPEVPEGDRLRTASYNGGAVLFGAIREWFALLSSRSLHGPAEMPTVDARVFIPKPTAYPSAPPQMIIDPQPHLEGQIISQKPSYRVFDLGNRSALTFTDPTLLASKEPFSSLRHEADAKGRPFKDLIYHGTAPLGPVALQVARGALNLGTEDSLHLHDLQTLGSRPNRWEGEPTVDIVMDAIKWVWEPDDHFPPNKGGYFRFWPKHWYDAPWNQLPEGTEGAARTRGKFLAFEIYAPPANHKENYRISLVRHLHEKQPPELQAIRTAVDAAVFVLFREREDHVQYTEALAKWQRANFPGADHLKTRFASWRRPKDLFDANLNPTPLDFIRRWLESSRTREAIACLTNFG